MERYHTIFCDESGNTGPNYLDEENQFFVIAGWILPSSLAHDTSHIERFLQDNGIEDEFKGSGKISRPKWQKIFFDFFHVLGQNRCVPIFMVAEKKFSIAAKIIETLLEPEFNRNVPETFNLNRTLKRKYVEILATKPNKKVLNDFITGYINSDIDQLSKSIPELVAELMTEDESQLAEEIEGSLENLENNTDIFDKNGDKTKSKLEKSPNTVTVGSFFALAETIARKLDFEILIIHDEIARFDEIYSELFYTLKESSGNDLHADDGTLYITKFHKLRGLGFAKSSHNLYIQSADILASSINRYMKEIANEEPLGDNLHNLLKLTFPATMDPELQMGDYICSEETMNKLWSAVKAGLNKGNSE